jgi:hypothetical protein
MARSGGKLLAAIFDRHSEFDAVASLRIDKKLD